MFHFQENELSVDEYLALRASVSWKTLSKDQAQRALDHSLMVLTARENGQLLGMGRLVGDGAVICYIQDLIVSPIARHRGLGGALVCYLRDYAHELALPGTEMMLGLMCAKGREGFYEQQGFIARPNPSLGPGMIQYLHQPQKEE